MNGTSGISGLTGGNCTREEYDEIQREFAGVEGWDGTLPESQDSAPGGPSGPVDGELEHVNQEGTWLRYPPPHPIVTRDDGRRFIRDGDAWLNYCGKLPDTPRSQESVSDAELGQCADVAAWYEERS